MRRRDLFSWIGAAAIWPVVGRAQTAEPFGVVLLHGKRGVPWNRFTGLDDLAAALRGAGYKVEIPEMCWSGRRIYDEDFDSCMGDVDAAVERLKKAGATAIVVAGLSLGGSGALGYGARRDGLAGIMAFAPTPNTHIFANLPGMPESIARAKQLVAAGQGDRPAEFTDWTNDRRGPIETGGRYAITITATPRIYLSFADADGPADEEVNIARLKAPLLMVWSDRDPNARTDDALFARAPANPLNEHMIVSSDHMGTADVSVHMALAWLKTLKPAH
jgi:pimeloyl-ACP methyl ester carboxylesterase